MRFFVLRDSAEKSSISALLFALAESRLICNFFQPKPFQFPTLSRPFWTI